MYRTITLNSARAGAMTVAAICGGLLVNGCSLLGSQSPPPPPSPAIINTSTDQVNELEHEVKQKDARIASLSSQLAASKEEVAQLKENKEFTAATPAVADAGNPTPVNSSEGTVGDSDSTTTASTDDDSGDTGNPVNITVWVSTSSNTYFLPGSRFYGKGSGQYMTEDQASNDGYKRGSHR